MLEISSNLYWWGDQDVRIPTASVPKPDLCFWAFLNHAESPIKSDSIFNVEPNSSDSSVLPAGADDTISPVAALLASETFYIDEKISDTSNSGPRSGTLTSLSHIRTWND